MSPSSSSSSITSSSSSTIKSSSSLPYLCLREIFEFALQKFEPEYNSLFDFNLFELPGAEISLTNLSKFSCYGEPYNINLYESASKISTKIQDLKIILFYGCPINPSTLINISNFIRSQHQIKEFFIDNRIGCDCCTHDLSLALDLTIIFKSLNTQISTLSRINFISIDFHNKFPFDQLSKCENLLELNIKGYSKEIQYLPKFLRSSTKLNKLEIWDKSMRRKEMELLEIINLDDELFSDIGESLPIKLKDLTINMKWNFSIKSFENFIKNCKAPLDILSFEFCECFDNDYFDILIKNLKRSLKKLNIRYCKAKLNSEIRKKNEYLIQQIDS
ncbi:hypothetical protein GLOIN_2v1874745 [Rhizophagus irregularis DAOM 181602=DAOM 197198]|nr:hypothetical protein GLOIN_2v1874745 [Rhizophagus irregularis DAOM 181602=DAOM 197198]